MAKKWITEKQEKILNEELNEMFEKRTFPVFDTEKYRDLYTEYPYYMLAERTIYEEYLDVSKISGSNWAFLKKEDRGNYPHIGKVKSIVGYYAGKLYHGNKDIPPIPLVKINGVYFLEEGNHRVYTLKYLKEKGLVNTSLIRAEVCEYDYDNFVKGVEVIERGYGYYLLTKDSVLHELEDEEAYRVNELKEKLK